MNIKEYQKLVKDLSPRENRLKNMAVAFFVGGLIGFLGEFYLYLLTESFGMSRADAFSWLCLTLILLGTLLTALGFFDNWFSKCKCG